MNWNNRVEIKKYIAGIARDLAHKRLGVLGFLLEGTVRQALCDTVLENLLSGEITVEGARKFIEGEGTSAD